MDIVSNSNGRTSLMSVVIRLVAGFKCRHYRMDRFRGFRMGVSHSTKCGQNGKGNRYQSHIQVIVE